MPELPEVEYTVRQMQESLIGATIQSVEIFWERTIGHPGVEDFLAEIAGRQIVKVRRRAKYIVIDLSGSLILIMHRRMTGNLLLLPAGWQADLRLKERDPAGWLRQGPIFRPPVGEEVEADLLSLPQPLYCRVVFYLEDHRQLLFNDLRKFGKISLWPQDQEKEIFSELGPEPLAAEFTVSSLQLALDTRKSAKPLKQILLQQEIIAGLGNIYVDEALYQAGIHPERRSDSLSMGEIAQLHKGIITVLTQGIEHGGTSFSDYRDLWGKKGKNADHLLVYQHSGRACERCGQEIKRIVIAQRSTHFCPGCQL